LRRDYEKMLERSDPRMHTAEHLLNAAMVALLGFPRAFSAHLDGRKGKCDYRGDRIPSEGELRRIERWVNDAIAANLPVRCYELPKAEAAARFDLSRLPADAPDSVRIIEIEGKDAIPCSGRHAATTRELGAFSIVGASADGGRLRLRFTITGLAGADHSTDATKAEGHDGNNGA
jgi:Ser-tRNA(Ala) deacylase AlaX